MKTLSGIVHSYTDGLLTRAADVVLKERRPLVLCVRETPFHLGHLRLLVQAAELGAVIMPPVPAFYHRPQSWMMLSTRPSTGYSISSTLAWNKTYLRAGKGHRIAPNRCVKCTLALRWCKFVVPIKSSTFISSFCAQALRFRQ